MILSFERIESMLKMEQTALMQADEKTQITAMEFAQSDIKYCSQSAGNVG